MFPFFRRKHTGSSTELLPLVLPLTSIKQIGPCGILYTNAEGSLETIPYLDAYKGWCQSKKLKRSRVKYICDRTKSDSWQLIFYTNPRITFYADPSCEAIGIDILHRITLQGYASLDWD